MTNQDDLKRLVDSTVEKYGRVDVLVNAAGMLYSGSLEATTMERFDFEMNVNFRSVALLSKLALPHILESKGNIVNVSSVTGQRAFPNVSGYRN